MRMRNITIWAFVLALLGSASLARPIMASGLREASCVVQYVDPSICGDRSFGSELWMECMDACGCVGADRHCIGAEQNALECACNYVE
jgi:hypothetical protein